MYEIYRVTCYVSCMKCVGSFKVALMCSSGLEWLSVVTLLH